MDRDTLLKVLAAAFIPCYFARAQVVAHEPSALASDTAALDCPWPGDMNGSAGSLDLADFAAFQRCYGLTDPDPTCDEVTFAAADLRADHEIGLDDYAAFAELAWPQPVTIDCGTYNPGSFFVERCGSPCLASLGSDVATAPSIEVTPRHGIPFFPDDEYRVGVARDAETLNALADPAPLGEVDFDTSEVILFVTPQAAENGCWETVRCFDGVVDLPDGRRAVIVGYVEHGPVICDALPQPVTRGVVVPRSDRPVVMLFIGREGEVTQTLKPVCD